MADDLTDERIAELRELAAPATTFAFSPLRVTREQVFALCDALLAARRARDEALERVRDANESMGRIIDAHGRGYDHETAVAQFTDQLADMRRERDEARATLVILAHAAERYRDLCYSRLPRDPADDMTLDEAEKLLDAAIAAARGGA